MIPVIIIHNGYQDYLKYTTLQANKNNFVYLLGDTDPNLVLNNYKFININNLDVTFDKFKNNYVHLNTTPFEYELFCYKRWFILKKFMEDYKIDIVFYIDSDVLLFVDVNKEWDKYKQYDMTLLHRTAAISSFITKRGIDNFCNMLDNIYSNKNGYAFKKIESHFNVRRDCKLAGGVCDMTLLEYFHYNSDVGGGPGRVGEMMTILNDATYDHNINTSDNDFEYQNGTKKIKIINKMPFIFNEHLKLDIKFNSLHFQGVAKSLIKNIYEQCN